MPGPGSHCLEVAAPSRLHFGLWSLAGGAERQYGGVGVMVAKPGLTLAVCPSGVFEATFSKQRPRPCVGLTASELLSVLPLLSYFFSNGLPLGRP